MLDANIKEYESIKGELASLRSSISAFLSISIGGSIVGSYFLFLSRTQSASYSLTIAISLFIALFLLSIYYILIYKFISHNRYVGYLCLICQEIRLEKFRRNKMDKRFKSTNLLSFEFCMSRLQAFYEKQKDKIFFSKDLDVEFWRDKMQFAFMKNGHEIDIWGHPCNRNEVENHWKKFKIYKPSTDEKKFRRGIRLLFRGLRKEDASNSWKYPFYVSYTIYINVFLFIGIAAWYYIEQLVHTGLHSYKSYFMTSYIFIFLITLLVILYKSTGELHCIMNGSKTINGFCWRFLEFRVEYLNSLGLKPYYNVTNIRLFSEMEKKA